MTASLHTLSIGFCAPVPQIVLTPIINSIFEGMTLSHGYDGGQLFYTASERQNLSAGRSPSRTGQRPVLQQKMRADEDLYISVQARQSAGFLP